MGSYATKVSGSDVSRALVLIMEMLGLNRSTGENYLKSLRVDLQISGQGRQFRNKSITFPIKNETIRFQTFSYSNYKSIYMFVPESIKFLMYADIPALMSERHCKDAFKYLNEGWMQTACHDSCWTEGFSLSDFIIEDISILSIELQEAKTEDFACCNNEIVEAVLSDKVTVEMKLPPLVANKSIIEFINSIVDGYSSFVKAFYISLFEYDEKTNASYDKRVMLCKNPRSSTHTASAYDFQRQNRVIVGDLNEAFLQYLLPNGEINHFSDDYIAVSQMLSREISNSLEHGKNYSVIAHDGRPAKPKK